MTVLQKILRNKKAEIERLHESDSMKQLKSRVVGLPPCRDLLASLKTCSHAPIIAEVKRVSPSAGTLRQVVDVGRLARSYQEAGAAGISVLTDRAFFGGSLEDLCIVRRSVEIPVLRKDFILDVAQLYETRLSGADAVLLIVAALSFSELKELYSKTLSLGMTPLVEVHTEKEAGLAMELQPTLIGINNRNLATLQVDLETCVKIRSVIPRNVTVVGESGINSPEEITRLRAAGIDAFLVGTTLMRADDPRGALRTLSGSGGV